VILLALDPFAIAADVISILVLIFALVVGWKAVRSFRQSRQAVTESASLLGVIVNSIGSRIESSESIVRNLALGLE
jgi:mannose/fructose/N-acetylgalactosamine-specific phosphotransferase system component IID